MAFWLTVWCLAAADVLLTWLDLIGHLHTVLWTAFFDSMILLIAIWRIYQVVGVKA
jgi:hypothetical protein